MKKLFCACLAVVLILSLTSLGACKKKNNKTNDDAKNNTPNEVNTLMDLEHITPVKTEAEQSDEPTEEKTDEATEEKTEKAIAEGVEKAVCEKFSFSEDCVSAIVFGFDFGEMKAEKIKLTLRGGAVFADAKAVKKFVSELGLGVCEVSFEI